MEFIKSNKGGMKIAFEGYVYWKQKELANEVLLYECELRRSRNYCKAKIKVKNNELVSKVNEHTHPADATRIQNLKALQEMKNRARDTQETPHQIVTRAVEGMSEECSAILPTISHLKRNLRQCRQRSQNSLPVPQNTQDLVIPLEYKNTKNGEQFLLYDSGPINQRILIFGTEKSVSYLEKCEHWYMDGTFSVTPGLFSQVYTIHGCIGGRVVPSLYCLLPDKSEVTYSLLLEKVIGFNNNLQPKSIMIDFERAMINSIATVFPNAEINGCFFHLSQNIYKKIQEFGLSQLYNTDANFSLKMRMIAALAFYPPDNIEEAFETLAEFLPVEANELMDYFEDNYIGRPTRTLRRPPRFAVNIWNMYSRVQEDLPKTNNAVEGWHRSFASLVGCAHPSIWTFIRCIRKEHALQEVYVTQVLSGHPRVEQKKIYKDTALRIKNIVEDVENRPILDFLKGIAYNLSF